MNETSCTNCAERFKPNNYKNECIAIIPDILAWNSPFALVPACFSAVGIVGEFLTVHSLTRF